MAEFVNAPQSIPADLAETRSPNKNFKFIAGGLLLIALVIFLIVQATVSTGAYYLTVAEVQEQVPGIYGERVRVNVSVKSHR